MYLKSAICCLLLWTASVKCSKMVRSCTIRVAGTYEVVSVAMTRYNDPSDIAKSTTELLKACDIETGSELFIA